MECKTVKVQVAGCSCLGSISQQHQHLQCSSVTFVLSKSVSSLLKFSISANSRVWLPFPQLSKKHLLLSSTEHYLSLYLPLICCSLLEVRLKVLRRLFIPALFSETPAHRSRGPCPGERRAGCLNDTEKKTKKRFIHPCDDSASISSCNGARRKRCLGNVDSFSRERRGFGCSQIII